MDYTIISIQGKSDALFKLHDQIVKPGTSNFNYSAVVERPVWVEYAPLQPVWLLSDPTELECSYITELVRTVSFQTTLRSWFLQLIAGISKIRRDPWKHHKRPNLNISHTIFDTPLNELLNVIKRQLRMRSHLSIREIYGEDIGEVIEFFIGQQLYQLTGFHSKNAWIDHHVGVNISGVLVESAVNLDEDNPYLGYCVQTVGGTPWTFFRLLSQRNPDFRISVSDVDIKRSIIQMKMYRAGKVVTTMTTEDTTIFKQFELHTTGIFSGVYFYLPLSNM